MRSLLLVAATLLACRERPAAMRDDPGAGPPESAVPALAESIRIDLSRNGPRAWLRYFERSPSFYMASEGKVVFPGYAAAESAMAAFAPTVRAMDLRWLDLRVEPLGPGAATLRSSFDETITDTGGHVTRFSGYVSGIAVRGDSGWKLRSLHWSLTPADSGH